MARKLTPEQLRQILPEKKMEGIYEIFQRPASPKGGCTVSKNLYDSQAVEELAVLFRQINTCQRMLRHAKEAKDTYADLVKRIMSPASAEEGERLAEEALKLITVIENKEQIKQDLWRYEAELLTRYGIRIGAETEEAV